MNFCQDQIRAAPNSIQAQIRIKGLIDKQRSLKLRNPVISKRSTHYITLEQGFQEFIKDLNKLQVSVDPAQNSALANELKQFIDINATAFSKILKKVSLIGGKPSNYY